MAPNGSTPRATVFGMTFDCADATGLEHVLDRLGHDPVNAAVVRLYGLKSLHTPGAPTHLPGGRHVVSLSP